MKAWNESNSRKRNYMEKGWRVKQQGRSETSFYPLLLLCAIPVYSTRLFQLSTIPCRASVLLTSLCFICSLEEKCGRKKITHTDCKTSKGSSSKNTWSLNLFSFFLSSQKPCVCVFFRSIVVTFGELTFCLCS